MLNKNNTTKLNYRKYSNKITKDKILKKADTELLTRCAFWATTAGSNAA